MTGRKTSAIITRTTDIIEVTKTKSQQNDAQFN